MIEKSLLAIGGILALFGSLAATATDNASLVVGGGFAALALSGLTILTRSFGRELRRKDKQLDKKQLDIDVSEWKFDLLLSEARKQGCNIPLVLYRQKLTQEDIKEYEEEIA